MSEKGQPSSGHESEDRSLEDLFDERWEQEQTGWRDDALSQITINKNLPKPEEVLRKTKSEDDAV